MRMRAKVDANQSEIVSALRQAGVTVQHLHTVGKGCPDLLCGWQDKNTLLEVKDGSKAPSKQKLTADELEWHSSWRGQVAVVSNVAEALTACGIEFRGQIS